MMKHCTHLCKLKTAKQMSLIVRWTICWNQIFWSARRIGTLSVLARRVFTLVHHPLQCDRRIIQRPVVFTLTEVTCQFSANSHNEHTPWSNRFWTWSNIGTKQMSHSHSIVENEFMRFLANRCGKTVSRLRTNNRKIITNWSLCDRQSFSQNHNLRYICRTHDWPQTT